MGQQATVGDVTHHDPSLGRDQWQDALAFVFPAYQLSEARWGSVDRRLETVIAGGFLPIILFAAAASGRPLTTWLFILGAGLIAAAVIAALVGRSAFRIKRLDLRQVEHSARQPAVQFARQMLVTTEDDIRDNDRRVTNKTHLVLGATALILIGSGLLILWLILTPV